MAGTPGDRTLKETPTWAVAVVCAVMVIISVMMEHGLNSLGKWFQKRQKKAMSEALEKIKAELMLMGFISLLLTVGQAPISKICIPAKAGSIMLPCKKVVNYRRKLLWHEEEEETLWRRVLAGESTDNCSKYNDKVSLISQSGIHQLHIFIFTLAVLHVIYSVLTMALGQAKMRIWKTWESETNSLEYQFSNDPSRFRFTHQTSFVRRHVGLSSTPVVKYVVAFFRQFFGSVSKVDYLTMRHGFVIAHLSPNSKFNFHKYIKRSLEDDFKVVVGISLPLWSMAIVILLIDVYGWYTLLWISFVPLIVLLLVGMKLEMVIMDMAHQIQERTSIVKGPPVIEPSNKYFWFNNPQWILFLIHLTLFQNAFQLAHFLWIWYTFGWKSCFHERMALTIVKVSLGIGLQIVCSYITFPLYALVTQMGTHMKKPIFEEQTARALKKWGEAARERKKLSDATGMDAPSEYLSGENTPSRGASPMHLLHKCKSSSADVDNITNSPRFYQSDYAASEMEMGSHMKKMIFEEQTARALKKWGEAARKRKKLRDATGMDAPSGYLSGENTPSRGASPMHLLHKYKSNSANVESITNSPRFYQSDDAASEMEAPTFVTRSDPDPRRPPPSREIVAASDFTFASP